MDTLAMLGALAATEGTGSMAILTAPQLPPGNISWTAREISTADQAFAVVGQSPVNTLMMASLCVVAWKEAVFMSSGKEAEEEEGLQRTLEDEKSR